MSLRYIYYSETAALGWIHCIRVTALPSFIVVFSLHFQQSGWEGTCRNQNQAKSPLACMHANDSQGYLHITCCSLRADIVYKMAVLTFIQMFPLQMKYETCNKNCGQTTNWEWGMGKGGEGRVTWVQGVAFIVKQMVPCSKHLISTQGEFFFPTWIGLSGSIHLIHNGFILSISWLIG